MQALKEYTGVKLICGLVIVLCGLTLVEILVVSIFANTNNIPIPVTDRHIAMPIALCVLGLVSAVTLLRRKKAGKYGLLAWFVIYAISGAHWVIRVYQLDGTISWNNIIFLGLYGYCLWYLLSSHTLKSWLTASNATGPSD